MFCYYSHLSTELCNISVIQEPPWVTCSSDHMSTLMREKKKKKFFLISSCNFSCSKQCILSFHRATSQKSLAPPSLFPATDPFLCSRLPVSAGAQGYSVPSAGRCILCISRCRELQQVLCCWFCLAFSLGGPLTVLMISVFLKASSLSRQFLHCKILNQEKLESELLGELYDHFMSYICCYYQRRSLIPISA